MEVQNEVDAVVGPSELIMYEVERIILDIDFANQQFTSVTRRACIETLSQGSPNSFLDACLFAGSSICPTVPQLDNELAPHPKPPRIQAAADLLRLSSLTADQFCTRNQEDAMMQSTNYHDLYRRAYMAIKHHITISWDGQIQVSQKDTAPNDVHTFMGQRLPEELYLYLHSGVVNKRVLTWRTTGEIVEAPPLDGGASVTYEMLVRDRLVPQRLQALLLLSHCLHRFYQHKNITLRCWFNFDQIRDLNINDAPNPQRSISDWNTHIDDISKKATELKVSHIVMAGDLPLMMFSGMHRPSPLPSKAYEIQISCRRQRSPRLGLSKT